MLRASDIIVDPRTLGNDETRCTRVSEDYEYVNRKKTDKLLGHKYDCVIEGLGFEQMTVRIPGDKQIDVPKEERKGIPVRFTNLELGITVQANNEFVTIKLKGTATGIERLPQADGKENPRIKLNQTQ